MTMNIFDKWALRRVEKIKKLESEEQKKRDNIQINHKEHRNAIKKIIESEVDKIAQDYDKENVHIKVGDLTILNYYSIKYPGTNGWDGGCNSLIRHIPKNERTKPITVIISRIYVDKSFSDELIDMFFNNHSNEWLSHNVKLESAWGIYFTWLKHKRKSENMNSRELLGLYKTAHFDYEGSFKPKWGLNVYSFHLEGTLEFQKTYDLWVREIEIDLKRAELNSKLEELKNEMKFIDEEYRNIKVIG